MSIHNNTVTREINITLQCIFFFVFFPVASINIVNDNK